MRFCLSCFFIVFFCFSFSGKTQATDSLEMKIGQMLMMGLPDNNLDTGAVFYKDVKAGKIGGITMYERHLTPANTQENLRQLISFYQAVSPIPLFVSITQEGGLVNRLKTKYGFLPMPSAAYLGKMNSPDSTKYYADNIAFTLSRLGININFAPVVDVYSATNPVLGSRERTFSSDPNVIIQQAEQMILSHNYFNVATALKHFPGHGSSTTDTHLQLTDVSKTWKREELKPYEVLIKKGLVKAVMTAHIVNTQLDKDSLPATLSKKMITGLLRNQLHFTGVVFSDDMQMKAISAEYGLKEAIAKAINAGVDVLLFSGNISGQPPLVASDLVAIIVQLVKEGTVSPKTIDASYRRIMQLKQRK
ncbi:MAG: glycoside hydrolase family 3 protein [Bacteroidota bacterium]|nr:glycoside hydrolase family 3 protein [Bacteroidota bacterium]